MSTSEEGVFFVGKGVIKMKNTKMVSMVAMLLVVVGGLNWGLVGLLDINLVMMLFGSVPMLEKLVYILVGVSAVYLAVMEWPKYMKS